jgi:hypothetical protein
MLDHFCDLPRGAHAAQVAKVDRVGFRPMRKQVAEEVGPEHRAAEW